MRVLLCFILIAVAGVMANANRFHRIEDYPFDQRTGAPSKSIWRYWKRRRQCFYTDAAYTNKHSTPYGAVTAWCKGTNCREPPKSNNIPTLLNHTKRCRGQRRSVREWARKELKRRKQNKKQKKRQSDSRSRSRSQNSNSNRSASRSRSRSRHNRRPLLSRRDESSDGETSISDESDLFSEPSSPSPSYSLSSLSSADRNGSLL